MSEFTNLVYGGTGATFRVFGTAEEPTFALNDACAILEIRNPRDAVNRLDPRDVGTTDTLTEGGRQQITVVNESGLYELIFQSRKPEARRFRRWITSEVLPSIRRTGSYGMPTPPPDLSALGPDGLAYLQQLATAFHAAVESAAKNQAKADAFDAFLSGEAGYKIGTVASMIGTGQKKLFDLLYEQKILISKGDRRRQPYSRPQLKGWFKVRTYDQEDTNGHASHTTLVTPLGLEKIRELAIRRGLVEPQLALTSPSSADMKAVTA